MPRQLRIEYPGAIYHVMNRGDQRELIYLDDADRTRFLQNPGRSLSQDRLANSRLLFDGKSFSPRARNPRRQV